MADQYQNRFVMQAGAERYAAPATPDQARASWSVLPGGIPALAPKPRHQLPALRPDLEIGGLIA